MASRAVANESSKWRAGRERVRESAMGPCCRGGKSADPLGDDERVATEHDRHVMMPPFEAATFEVIESELALQLLVNALGLPTLFDRANDLLLGHAMSELREIELRRFCIVFEPFDDDPDRLQLPAGHVVC